LAVLLLFGSYYIPWSFVVFPFWVFLISIWLFAHDTCELGGDPI
jgi:hypothetical protein